MRAHSLTESLEQIVRRLVDGLQPEQIILFGSYAYGQPTAGSDLDILVIVSESTEPPHHRAQKAYRCVGSVGIPKDLLVLTREEFEKQMRIVTSLARRVKERGKVLYERRDTHRGPEVVDQEASENMGFSESNCVQEKWSGSVRGRREKDSDVCLGRVSWALLNNE